MKNELFRRFSPGRSAHENLTDTQDAAHFHWEITENNLKRLGRTDLLQHPIILDIGGGTAEMSAYLNQRGGWKCVSVDDDRSIRKKDSALQVRADAGQLPFPEASFDIVYEKGMFDANIYEMNWEIIIPEIHRVLKPRGVLCIFGADCPPDSKLEQFFTRLNPTASLPIWEKK